ncbi:hypothetical protein Asch02_04008 [Acinetobacter schindleri]
MPFFFILSPRQVGHLISRVIRISLFYQNSTCFVSAYFLKHHLIINYVKRSDVQGSIFASHFTWQIRTFWWYLAWNIIAFLPFIFLFFTGENTDLFAGVAISSTVFCVGVITAAWIWIVYRAIRGLIALNDNRPMYQ